MNKYLSWVIYIFIIVVMIFGAYGFLKEVGVMLGLIMMTIMAVYIQWWERFKRKRGWTDRHNILALDKYVIGIDLAKGKDQTIIFDEVTNLLLNMSAGLLPEHLQKDEINLLKIKYGEDWFKVLGYTEPEYKKPECL